MNPLRHALLLLAVAGIGLSGCSLPTPAPGTPTPALPTCPTGGLQAVTLVDPPMWSTVASLSPTLHWTYPDPTCNPEGYAISLSTGPLFTDERGGGTGNPSTSWSPGSALEPGKEYKWGVEPINGTTLGPYAGSNYFFTGPTCATASLVAPTLLQPADGGTLDYTHEGLIWDYPDDCAPQGYRVDLSTDPTFADTSLSGGTGNPSTRWGPGSPLTECETYYWRVAAINDTTLGAFSASRSFTSETSGFCSASPPASASFSGIVWHDMCALPDGPLPSPLPEGCEPASGGGAQADGIQQIGEPGIPGVQVRMHASDDCSSPVTATDLTDPSGVYLFDGILAFGNYCISIDPTAPPNDSVLIPGSWTFPAGMPTVAHAVGIAIGGNIYLLNFGWDYQFLPVYGATPTPVPGIAPASGGPFFNFDKNAFCREGPGPVYHDITAIQIGERVQVLGRSQDSLWLFILWDKFKVKCWVGSSTGHLDGILDGVAVMAPPPTPTPTPAPARPKPPTPTGGKQ